MSQTLSITFVDSILLLLTRSQECYGAGPRVTARCYGVDSDNHQCFRALLRCYGVQTQRGASSRLHHHNVPALPLEAFFPNRKSKIQNPYPSLAFCRFSEPFRTFPNLKNIFHLFAATTRHETAPSGPIREMRIFWPRNQ